ncbi:DUF6456 domain-containing protein [Roseibium sp.]|uniref:DUF6456 domain-containing protein n=1 Tax=Roseibium sp. TaxID=1936156 RepID=UPI003A971C10
MQTDQASSGPSSAHSSLAAQSAPLLRRLAVKGRHIIQVDRHAGDPKWLLAREGSPSGAPLDAALVDALLAAGLLVAKRGAKQEALGNSAACSLRSLCLSSIGKQALRRTLSGGEGAGPTTRIMQAASTGAASQDLAGPRPAAEAGGGQLPTLNLAESPLAWLARRRDRKGQPLLQEHQVVAGEKLRSDYEFGGLMPQYAGGWRMERISGAGGGRGNSADLTDQVIAARNRTERVLEQLPPVLSKLVVDICCSLKGLETVEAERGWPARSAKIVLQIALSCLADAYGLTAQGKAETRLRIWRG